MAAKLPDKLEIGVVDHLPLIKGYADRLGLVDLINRLVPTHMEVEPGIIVLGMVLDTLSGRSPLYHLSKFFEKQDTELLLGRQVEPNYFNDDSVGRVLDSLYESGTCKLFSEICLQAYQRFEFNIETIHFDTTSVSVYGDYAMCNEEEWGRLRLTHGYSKDKRPDLKQFLASMVCVGGKVPIFGRCNDGNASDKTINNELLSEIS